MNRTAIRNFAIWARRELISRVSQKAAQYGITENDSISATADAVHGRVLSETEKKQRMSLIARIHRVGYSQTMEEIAYTWFNRFCALRFMEVNSYLPSLVRVFSDEKGDFKPQILACAIDLELDGLDREKVFAFKKVNQTEELYQYLLITQCNALSSILPGMFQRIDDETELLCPDNLLREGSVIAHMVRDIPEDNWLDAVQIIGWLYQYYNSEPKDQVFANLKKNIKISKENIPAATQLFTPDWIVRYMVENSLGRIFIRSKIGKWIGSETERRAKEQRIATNLGWKYYLPEAEQTKEARAKLNEQISECRPDKLKVIDPCMGSGHILVYLFDVLMQIYREYGYDNRDAVANIISSNLYGLDIDERATQLSYFAVMMKARQYDRGFFRRNLQPKVYAVCESNNITPRYLDYFCKDNLILSKEIHRLTKEFHDAKEYGSILKITPFDFNTANNRLEELKTESDLNAFGALMELRPLLQCAETMVQKYDVVVTNPPYMGGGGMSAKLTDFVKSYYPDSKADLFAVFIEQGFYWLKPYGYSAMVTMQSWMFLSSFERMRRDILDRHTIVALDHMANMVMGIAFGTSATVWQNKFIPRYRGNYFFVEYEDIVDGKPSDFPPKNERNRLASNQNLTEFHVSAEELKKIPGNPIAYWMSSSFINVFGLDSLASMAHICNGFTTGNNDLFLRQWFEVSFMSVDTSNPSIEMTLSNKSKWFPYNKGGEYRKWYGNNEYVINWGNNGRDIKAYGHLVPRSLKYQFCESVSWSKVTSSSTAFRYKPVGTMFDVAGLSIFPNNKNDLFYFLALGNSIFAKVLLKILSPTLNYETGHVGSIPVIRDSNKENLINCNSSKCISTSKQNWDSYETSWDFKTSPLINKTSHTNGLGRLSDVYGQLRLIWEQQCEAMRRLEVENNQIFIAIYGLQEELSPEVPWDEITLTCNPWYRYGKKPELEPDGQHFSTTGEIKVGTGFGMQPNGIKVSTPNPIMKVSSFPFNQELENRLLQDTIKELISYTVGCMFGRYSLDVPGLVYAGGKWDASKYVSFPADDDNIIPICDNDYFKDDLSSRFVTFIETVYGSDSLEENLTFIAKALGGRGSSREVIRKYFREEFFADHCKMYQKRPIYWLFDSGKKGGFRALVYMHRYRPDTIAKMRTDYIHEQQERYRTAMADLEVRIDKASGGEKIKLEKQMREYREQAEETRLYEEKIHHLADKMISIDLDDGVKYNYAIFQDVLAKIK